MANRLANSNSPYLLQHKDNPVEWFPWGEEALEKAKREDKAIFLSVGYAACHWCHVMAHESFEDEETAAIMNEHFVNIKVDREERPDIDGIYMNAVIAMTGSGGWPMSVFLSSEGEPFMGGTYFPPVARHGLPSFKQVLEHVNHLWQDEREKVQEAGQQMIERMKSANLQHKNEGSITEETLEQAVRSLAQSYDWQNGGWGRAPKFPQAMAIDFLLGRASQGDESAQEMASHALKAMARGGMYDVVGGGFSRYSVDEQWLVPHFEKMLYDNALLARAYLHAYLITKEASFRSICERTLDFVASEMRDASGAFYSSLDADSEGEEGKYYLWSLDEIDSSLNNEDDFNFLKQAYDLSATGNFEGKIIFQSALDLETLSAKLGLTKDEINAKLDKIHKIFFSIREKRVRPGTDDKALTSWNAMMLSAFAEAARYLHRQDYLDIAIENADFMLESLFIEGKLLRSWRRGKADHNAYLEDYAATILALLALFQSDPDIKWYRNAELLTQEMIAHFSDPNGGFFDTSDDHEILITRPKDVQDNATPSGNSLAALALLQMSAYSGNGDWHDMAMRNMAAVQEISAQHAVSFSSWLQAMSFALGDGKEIALIGKKGAKDLESLKKALWENYRPFDIVAISDINPEKGAPALLANRPLLDGKASAYVCQHFVCKQPVNSPEELVKLL